MFRRKDELEGQADSLFNTQADSNQQSAHDEPSAAAPQAASAPAPTTPSYGYSNTAPSSSQPARPLAEARPASAPAASAFRTASAPASAAPSELPRNRMPDVKPTAATAKQNQRVLTVGNDILLKGEIASCDRLVIEGKVDATVNDVHTVEIAESGSFKGIAQVEDAEISGLFEGELTVRGRLIIYATGKVRGKIAYGEIEIQRGGELTGEIKLAGQVAASRPARPAAAAAAPAKEAVAA